MRNRRAHRTESLRNLSKVWQYMPHIARNMVQRLRYTAAHSRSKHPARPRGKLGRLYEHTILVIYLQIPTNKLREAHPSYRLVRNLGS